MEKQIIQNTLIFQFLLLLVIPFASGWGFEGHIAICKIAQARLSKTAAEAVEKLLPPYAKGDLGQLCPWPDRSRLRYRWSSGLHYINTPDKLCNYKYARDCKDRSGNKDFCLEGAIKNYTTQLLRYGDKKPQSNNLTEALLFLSHFIGDIHQPLHVGFTSDKGGNTINITWFTQKQVLHHVWDTDIIVRRREVANELNIDDFVKNIQQKIDGQWEEKVIGWEACCCQLKTCPNEYAAESIQAACRWAYRGVHPGSILKEKYYKTRWPIVEERLAQAGVRLAAALNRIFN